MRFLRWFSKTILVAGFIFQACSSPSDSNDEGELEIVNSTQHKIYYLAIEAQFAHLVDLNPAIFSDPDYHSQIEAGNSAFLKYADIDGYEAPGDTLHFWYWTVPDNGSCFRMIRADAGILNLTGFCSP